MSIPRKFLQINTSTPLNISHVAHNSLYHFGSTIYGRIVDRVSVDRICTINDMIL